MTDMRVKMVLDLVNRTTAGAKAAARDLKGVKDAANSLNGTKGGAAIAADMSRVSPASRKAAASLREVRTAERGLGQSGGADRLQARLDRARSSAARLRTELARSTALADLNTAKGKGGGAGAGAAMLAAGRGALMPLAAAYGGYRAAGAGVRGTVGQSISFEKAMAEVRKKVDGMDDPAQLAAMEKTISKAAIAYGRTREEVAALVAEAGAGGVKAGDMPEFMRINLAAATAWDVSADKAGNALAKIRAATQWTNPQLEDFVDKVNALSDAGASKEMDVVDMFQRAGAAAQAAGVQFDTSLAFLTAMNNVAIAPEVAARGFNAFASNLRTATEQPERVAEGLKMLGLTAKGVEKGMKTNATATMVDVLERLEKHADKAKAAIKVFGKEWWDEVARTGQALPEIRKNLDIVNERAKWKGSAQNSLNIQLQTTDAHLKRLSALSAEVGDKLGRWALPAINEGIEKILAGMNELEKRAADRKAETSLAEKVAAGIPLTAEERAQLVTDRQMAARVTGQSNAISARKDYQDTAARMDGADAPAALSERAQLLRRQLQRQIATLEAELKLAPDGLGDRRKNRRLENLRKQLADIPYSPFDQKASTPDPRRPADQAERGRPDRAEVMALKERIAQQEQRLAALDELIKLSANPADKAGFRADRAPYLQRRAQAEGEFRRRVAPTLAAAGNFGFGPGGSPATARPQGAGPGRLSFGLNGATSPGAAWAEKIKGDFDVDLGPAGMTMMERLTAGVRAGGSGAQGAADGVKSGITGAFDGADLSGAGNAMMATLTTGIRSGGAQAVAAAREVAAQVKAATASGMGAGGGKRPLSGALHDGVE